MTGTTRVGVARDRYADEVESRPSRFTDPGAYLAWCERADAWAAEDPERSA